MQAMIQAFKNWLQRRYWRIREHDNFSLPAESYVMPRRYYSLSRLQRKIAKRNRLKEPNEVKLVTYSLEGPYKQSIREDWPTMLGEVFPWVLLILMAIFLSSCNLFSNSQNTPEEEVFSAYLSSQDGSDSWGVVSLNSGSKTDQLDALIFGLEDLPDGQFYEAWLLVGEENLDLGPLEKSQEGTWTKSNEWEKIRDPLAVSYYVTLEEEKLPESGELVLQGFFTQDGGNQP